MSAGAGAEPPRRRAPSGEPRRGGAAASAGRGPRRGPTPLTDARAALGFLTRIPVGDTAPLDAARLSRAAAWFPVVGLLAGGVLGGTRLLTELALPPEAATVLALAAAIALTGALHEDGLADAADGLGAHVPRERKLEILRDSRIGTFGAAALILVLLLSWTLLAPLTGEEVLRAALCAHVLSRWSILPQSLLSPARADGSSGTLVRANPAGLAAGSALAIAVALLAGGPGPGALALAVAGAVTLVAGGLMTRALGGVTGDSFGAVSKLVEVAVYAALVAAW
ncbi:MAG: adenosylcobinamide-GDP ribazoletransferase [Solirubrobacteraceae bacterium MAG38_C4-C5]|nr:adenosylcobinamide-GDP ribazoletransferase [Candidatus Siliceabacter maunaloa]